MQLVSTVTVGAGGASQIQFDSIPQNGTDLLCVVSSRGTTTGTSDIFEMRFNGQTAGFSGIALRGSGSSVTSFGLTRTVGDIQSASTTSNTFNSSSHYIANYASASSKVYLSDSVTENNATAASQVVQFNHWANSSAITSLTLVPMAGSWAQHSTASLYIITKA